ncbi:MAG: exodeoxyribonuclease V subunit gamma [Myxococcota bacterium]|nr:exodeoxyribonuclease V subunit gamma [Myxococcota bacterium]
MQLYVSNHLEELVAVLAERVAEPCPDGPLAVEAVAVQGRGMERWLAMQLSQRLGVWANAWFPFPRNLIERAFEAVLGPEPPGARRFEREAMTWKIAELLPGLLERDGFASIRSYLQDDALSLRRIQLASRIAATFDSYLIYRPEMIRSWDRGADRDGWQPMLWRSLVGQGTSDHVAARAAAFLDAIEKSEGAIEGLPARIHLFGLTTLPPLYVDVLVALSERVETNLFRLACTREPEATAADANPLWDSLGFVGRDFHQVLTGRVRTAAEIELFRDPGLGSMLSRLQRCLLEGEKTDSPALEEADRSIQVHACHGPMREVEVLHDQLTLLFEQDESLDPRDVLVMTPGIETYAPFIEAVFGPAAFAYQVADRGVRATHEIVDAFSRVLEVLEGRLTASGVSDLLMLDRVRRRFGIEAADLDVLLAWVEAAGIRWGVDAVHRSETGQPASEQNTWRQGLDRLLLGLALPADGVSTFADLSSAPGVELGRADLLGRFVEFCEALFVLRERLHGTRSVEGWSQELAHVLDAMVDRSDDGAEQHASILSALSDLTTRAKEAGFEDAVGLASVRQELTGQLERGSPSRRFLSGGVTFCQMVPMRSIPFRVVVLLGMNDEAFPRNREPLGFDLMPASRRPGDRTDRDDDRYLFLEALISARDHLIVTYEGSSVQDGSKREPSVVVGELLEELGADARKRIVSEHPRQPFSPAYFDGSDASLVSYSEGDCKGARALVESRAGSGSERRPRFYVPVPVNPDAPADPDDPEPRTVDLARLGRFFEHPARGFLQHRLGLYLRDEAPQLEDREPVELDGLASWKIGDRLLAQLLEGFDPERAKTLLRAEGLLPLGSPGNFEADKVAADASELAAAVRDLQRGDPLPPLEVDLRVAGWQIVGELGGLWPDGRIAFQFSKLPHACELSFWVHHLVSNCLAGDAAPRTSFLVGRGSDAKRTVVLELPPTPEAETQLAELLALYELGMSVPLPLLPQASRAQADFGRKQEGVPGLAPKAVAAWEDSWGRPPEKNDPYLRQAFRDIDVLDPGLVLPGGESFVSLAERIYEPYLSQRVERA